VKRTQVAHRFSAALVALTITVEAPPSLESAAARIRAIDQGELQESLVRAGLELPPDITVMLVPEDAPFARDSPRWIVGRAFGARDIAIFPARVTAYPYDSLESVLRHEVVHLALFARAAGRPLPRWFHEGVATSVEAGWGVGDELRLVAAALAGPTIDDVSELFRSPAQPDTTLAYLLATALVNDVRERHGPDLPGRVAARVGAGMSFEQAFAAETGETENAAAAHAWRSYRRWTSWVPAVASASAVWILIMFLAFAAFLVRMRQRVLRRRRWAEEEEWPADE
jgi:hypothetical protein